MQNSVAPSTFHLHFRMSNIFLFFFILVIARGADTKFSGESGTFFAVGVALSALVSKEQFMFMLRVQERLSCCMCLV